MKQFYRGLLPSPPDDRDYPLAAFIPTAAPERPAFYDAPLQSPVRDQTTMGACVAFTTVVGMKEAQERREALEKGFTPVTAFAPPLSPLFLYQLCKQADGIPKVDGTYFRVALKILQDTGVCLEACLPYVPELGRTPCPNWREDAAKYKIGAYAACPAEVELVKAGIYEFGGVMAGVYTSLSWSRTRDGHVADMKRRNQRMGGHAIWITGWNDQTGRFRFKNSWGTKWGQAGYGTLSYKYLEDQMVDGWTSVDA